MELSIDAGRCIGCGMCAAAVPEVFRVVDHVSTVLACLLYTSDAADE